MKGLLHMWPQDGNWWKWMKGLLDRHEHTEKTCQRSWEKLQARWKEWAGELLGPMLAERDAAVRFLTHHEPGVRRCATSVLLNRWEIKPGEEGVDAIYRIATTDLDDETQLIAVRALGNCYENTDDIVVGRALASLVYDDTRPPLLRTFAYYALFQVRGLRLPWIPSTTERPSGQPRLPRAPQEVDWSFVDTFFVESREPAPQGGPYRTMPASTQRIVMRYDKAETAYHCGKYNEAVELFSEVIAIEPQLLCAYLMRARALSRSGRLDEAIRDLTLLIDACPDWAPAFEERADVYRQKGLARKAEADAAKASRLRGRQKEQLGSDFQY